MKREADISVAAFLSDYDPRLQTLAHATRRRILTLVPHATERVRLGWRLIGYNAPAYFAFISLDGGRVRIGFEWGVMLSDPKGLLEGTGTQVRYVTVHSATSLKPPAVADLIRAAHAIVPPSRALRRVKPVRSRKGLADV